MTTITINSKSAEARKFLQFVKTLPFVVVNNEPVKRFKPEVEQSILASMQGKDRVAFDSLDELFADLDT